MLHMENYWIYSELVQNKFIQIHTKDITCRNWKLHHDSIFNIMLDTIELEEMRYAFVKVIFDTGEDVELSIYDYWQNLIFWYLQVAVDKPIMPYHLIFEKTITKYTIKNYIDRFFIPQNREHIENIRLNNIIADSMHNFVKIDVFSMYLANTINMSDFIDLMNTNKEVYDIIHSDFSNVPLDDNKKAGMEAMNRLTDIIKDTPSHCLCNFIRAGEGLNKKQAKEVLVNIGTKPDGLGGIYPYQINTNYFMGGVNELIPFFIESSTARMAQIIIKKNVGDSGYFSRLMGLNNLNSKLHDDPNYVCDCHPSNYIRLYIENIELLNSLAGQYYRLHPQGIEDYIRRNDKSLVGKVIYLASPMTCASAARGEGICYRCYGKLANTVKNVNIGKIASENICAPITQMMLSAKHLIEAEIIKMVWTDIFMELFEIDYNIIILREDLDIKGYKFSINLANKSSDYEDDEDMENDSLLMNEYINEFDIIDPSGESHKICTQNYDPLYLTPELDLFIEENKKKIVDDVLTLPLSSIDGINLFAIRLENNDLTKTLERVTNIINKTSEVAKYDKNSILQAFLMTIQECNLNILAVHCQVILMNQIRALDDVHEKPRFEIMNQNNYQLLTLKRALKTNPSVTISLMYQDIKRILVDPDTFRKTAPGITDLFYMKQPQEYLSDEFVERKSNENNKRIILHYD